MLSNLGVDVKVDAAPVEVDIEEEEFGQRNSKVAI